MTLSVAPVRHYLQHFNFERLFVEELGWDLHAASLSVIVDGRTHSLQGLAEKRGVQIFLCNPVADGKIPDHAARRKIERQVTKSAYEHLIIFVDEAHTAQIWQWVAREPGQPAKYREYSYHPNYQAGESLVQKLQSISFQLSEEEAIDLTGTVHRLRDAFDRDRVTKKFYDRFKVEHGKFLQFIEGITETADLEWYGSLMLNRLMFVYFIQQKAFLDSDQRYLQNRLQMVQERKGKGSFYTFYRYFLLRLFHEGFSQQPVQRAPDLEELLGEVPYLNGGLFEVHQLEQKYPEMDIPDEAFERLFAFFDQYEWHLDTRPLQNGREINPDVLGYIFEKFVNQKQMGAYYTKEDITEYISKNTIIPYLFDSARKKCAIAFEPESALWQLLQHDPDRYIYEPVRRGVIDQGGQLIPESSLPEFVQIGMNDPKARMFDKRYNLGQADFRDDEDRMFTLPTETWREYVNRRKRCLDLREKLARGEVHDINDFITYNLNIRQFAEDAINTCEGPELLRAFYAAISTITVLDPTCGSGAFLFAALNILEPLYEACLVRMEAFLEDLEHSGERHRPEKFSDFRRVLAEIEKHPNRCYFILKSIIVKNLYGVDIMEEAVEICKLRLFLKLVAQVDRVKDLEPLPDIDFNIRPGNTLVGFARLDDVKRTLDGKLGFRKGQVDKIIEDAEIVDRAYRRFHEMQTIQEMNARDFASAKQDLRQRLAHLTEQLDRYLATDYNISQNAILDENKYEVAFSKWRSSHQPFHWFAEFYGIMSLGGFNAIIGNPPYVVYSPAKVEYSVEPMEYRTISTRNLYSYVFERSAHLAGRFSPVGLIVQLSAISSEKMSSLQDLLSSRGLLLALPFPRRPQSMFDGVEMPVAILLSFPIPRKEFATACVGRVYREERQAALQKCVVTSHDIRKDGYRIAKIGSEVERNIMRKLGEQLRAIGYLCSNTSGHIVYYQEACRYWLKASAGLPHFKRNGRKAVPPHGRILHLTSTKDVDFVTSLLNSSLFFWFYSVLSDCEHVNDQLLRNMKIPGHQAEEPWASMCSRLEESLKLNCLRKKIRTKQGHLIEYDEMTASLSKHIIDEIDVALAAHYGFTNEELDFIINYDIKYRMGRDSGEDEFD
ncbi:MAG TPA: DNA methyltransferase [Desulfatiglandales bacterium]|nr:DNA methyltransferase [Desulfatiglandales bacterium]